MTRVDSFAVESGEAQEAVEWMNAQARDNGLKFEAHLEGYTLSTNNFGQFEVMSFKGDWSTAVDLVKKASRKLKIKVIEARKSADPLESLFIRTATGKLYSNGKQMGEVKLQKKSGKWIITTEKLE